MENIVPNITAKLINNENVIIFEPKRIKKSVVNLINGLKRIISVHFKRKYTTRSRHIL